MTLSIIIPCYNEAKTIKRIINRVIAVKLQRGVKKEILVVDDGSLDGTVKIISRIRNRNLRLIRHRLNLGKGAAIRTGLSKARGDIFLIQDADLEYSPKDYPSLIAPILEKKAKVVYGSRELNRGNNKHSYFSFYIGGLLVTGLTNLLYWSALSDVPTGYKVFTKDVLGKIKLRCRKFEFCPEVTAKILKLKYPIIEVPIAYLPRSIEEGKKIRWVDGLQAIWTLFKYRFVN